MRTTWQIQDDGVSLVEMIVVLMLLGIVSAVVISRIARTDDIELVTQVNSFRNHIRYAQVMAMKSNDMTWGIKCDGTVYWVFKTASPQVASEPDDTNNMVYLTTRDIDDRIKEKKQLSLPEMDAFAAIYFNRFGIPHTYQGTDITPISSAITITIGSRSLLVTPQTGFVE